MASKISGLDVDRSEVTSIVLDYSRIISNMKLELCDHIPGNLWVAHFPAACSGAECAYPSGRVAELSRCTGRFEDAIIPMTSNRLFRENDLNCLLRLGCRVTALYNHPLQWNLSKIAAS